ncbi:RNA-guided endonuclease InsQ/TnpB family protein [Gloeocapsopsis dulcis]|uniref:Transposase n=1 Tax=Gloeocapsopsis dulcis AAB1 = 1H9 TaxID=1433147 RepID=A0A6N8FUP5_9CHRO|nr:RNA-guided endonuclease TnpB family protein [Gloeocapsopsis dulcis]MUL36035.1 transposase [Gloeocapsopsis dulcis AAB1 = 1H9]WNN88288.1 transposase [Gloeocapsopsis dulcis]
MKARYQYCFYPTDQQQQSLAQLFGCVRVVWNDALAFSKVNKYPGYNSLAKSLTLSKKTEGRQWLNDVSSVPLQQSLKQLEIAYKNYFDSLKRKRKDFAVSAQPNGKKVGQPRFKKKTNAQSATFTKAAFSIKDGNVYLAKIGNLKPIWSRELPSEPSSVTVIKDCANCYFLSFVVEIEPNQIDAKNQSIGIDLGIKTFATMSNGEKVESPNYSKQDRKIRKLQRKLARQRKDSKRRNKTRIQIAKLHNQIVDTRKDFLHKLSTKIVNENQTIVLEDLNVSGMVKNRRLARSISLQGWREFRTLCEAKSEKLGREFQTINRWEPTSQICSDCGFRWGKLDLSIRSVLCLNCGTEQDRDENAARNIEAVALREVPSRKHLQQEMVGTGHRHDLKWTGSDRKTSAEASYCEPPRITVTSVR